MIYSRWVSVQLPVDLAQTRKNVLTGNHCFAVTPLEQPNHRIMCISAALWPRPPRSCTCSARSPRLVDPATSRSSPPGSLEVDALAQPWHSPGRTPSAVPTASVCGCQGSVSLSVSIVLRDVVYVKCFRSSFQYIFVHPPPLEDKTKQNPGIIPPGKNKT
jgi:hypothetical protein